MAELERSSKVGIIGAGTVGNTLAVGLARQGYPVVAAASRRYESAQALAALVPGCLAHSTVSEAATASDFVLITSPDDAIGPIASEIDWRPGQGVAHCSGVASLDVLEHARSLRAYPGAIHPLQTFSSVDAALKSLPGTTFAIEGDNHIRPYLTDMALALGGNPIFLRPEDKALYHTSVVFMGGLLTGLAGAVAEMWAQLGIDRSEALKALTPIIRGGADTLEAVGVPGALAGPYVRGDLGTIRKHMAALKAQTPAMLPVYCHMALVGLPLALEKGRVSDKQADEIRGLLTEALTSASDH